MNFKIIILISVLFSSFTYADGKPQGVINKESFCFVNTRTKTQVTFFSDISELEKKLGKSINGLNEKELTISWFGMLINVNPQWEYNNSTKKYIVVTDKYLITMATIENSDFSTIDGVSIGDDIAKIVKLYGEPYSKTNTIYQYLHNEPEEVWNLNIFLIDGKVNKISIVRGD